MSEGDDKKCPTCAEDMDLTDQQLKPCKCGYEICVWCWHQIMDMAEKDNTKGLCPACRIPYNKEKILATNETQGSRLVSEIGVDKRLKSHKGKSKIKLEERMQLENVRVVQKNKVFVMGFPINFADENLLQRNDFFGQYGKVLKVNILQTAAGALQQNENCTCSVFVLYSTEEEAIQCIQSVNGFVLGGRRLKANFGTSRYCHAWLRNTPCNYPDCHYLHEVGSQEDTFDKNDIASIKKRVQQLISALNSMERQCSGNVLPPPTNSRSNNQSIGVGVSIHPDASSIHTNKPPHNTTDTAESPINCSAPDVDNDTSIENISSDMSSMGIRFGNFGLGNSNSK